VGEIVERLYERHADLVFHIALRCGGGDRAWAEDVTQDVFVGLFDHAHQVARADNPAAWFYRVTTNRCLSRLRRERFLDAPGIRMLLRKRVRQPPSPEALGIVRDDLARAFAIVATAAPKARIAFFMYHVDGKSLDEIAKMVGHSTSWVCKLIKRVEARIAEAEARHG
jgi:RNA polymerase sigma-70 factor, ECF subfamily